MSRQSLAIADIVVAAHIETTMISEELDHMEAAICTSLSGTDLSLQPHFCWDTIPELSTGVVLNPGAEFASQLGSAAATADCYLTPDEIAADATTFPGAVDYLNSFREQRAAELGVTAADIVVSGISFDADSVPGCAPGAPAPPGSVGGGIVLQIDPDYAASLGSGAAFADCFLTADEIASDPEATAFADIIRAQVAASTGTPIETIIVTGLSTDGDDEPGCAGSTGPSVSAGVTIQVSSDFTALLGDTAAFDDCFLTTDEILSDPEAMAFAQAVQAVMAAQTGVAASDVVISGISTDGDDQPGCSGSSGPSSGSGMIVQVNPTFAATLGDPAAFVDCWLSPEEIASDPEAAAFAAAFTQTTAATLGIDPSAVTLGGISTAGLSQPGCSPSTSAAGSAAEVAVTEAYAATLGDGGGFDDCTLSADEIAADAEAAALAQAFVATQAAALGVPVEDIVINSIVATGGLGCSAVPHAAASLVVGVSHEFANSLGSPGFLDDCWISAAEIASNPAAADLAAAIVVAQAAAIGIDPATVTVTGMSTVGNQGPGCSTTGRRMQDSDTLSVVFDTKTAARGYAKSMLKQQTHFVSHILLK